MYKNKINIILIIVQTRRYDVILDPLTLWKLPGNNNILLYIYKYMKLIYSNSIICKNCIKKKQFFYITHQHLNEKILYNYQQNEKRKKIGLIIFS